MGSVDDRVVAMKFDNAAFENKVGATIATLAKLKGSLDFSSSTKNLGDLQNATKGFSLEGIGQAVDNISSRFSAMGVVAATVLSNITSAAINAGASIVKALTIDPLNDGFTEYETNMTSIQTILGNTAAKGTTLDQVSASLDELNEYSDQTIYNFAQMAKNVGTFTAAGVSLEESTGAIKGIANLSALSGSSAEQASSAMYQLSQAMASGSVKAQDWISVVNAGIGGEVFKSSLFEAGKLLGTITDVPLDQSFQAWTDAGGNFKDIMSEGVITSDVLSLSLRTFTGDMTKAELVTLGYTDAQADAIMMQAQMARDAATQVKTFTQLIGTIKESVGTGWANTFKLVLGDFEEAKVLFTGLNNIASGFISRAAEARNSRLFEWDKAGGREAIIQSLRNVMWSLATVAGTLNKAFRDVFPRKTGEDLADFSKAVERFTRALIPSENTLKVIGAVFGTIFSVLSIGWTVVKEIGGAFIDLFSIFGKFSGGGSAFVDFITNIGDNVKNLKKTLVDDGGIAKFIEGFAKPIIEFVDNIDFGGEWEKFVNWLTVVRDKILEFFGTDISGLAQTFTDAFDKIKSFFNKLFGTDISPATDAMGAATDRLSKRWESFMQIGEKLGSFFGKIGDMLEPVKEFVKTALDSITKAFKDADYNQLLDGLNVGLLAGLGAILLKFINDGKFQLFGGLFDTIKESINGLTGVFKAMQTDIKADALMRIAIAVAILTASLLVLSLIDSVAMLQGISGVTALLSGLVIAMKELEKSTDDSKSALGLAAISAGILLIAAGIFVLALAMKVIASIDPVSVAKGIATIVALLAGLVKFLNELEGSGKRMVAAGLAVISLSVGLFIFAKTVERFGELPLDVLLKGLGAIGAALLMLTLATKYMKGDDGAKLLKLGLGMLAIAFAIKVLGEMDPYELAQGLIAFAGTVALITLSLKMLDGLDMSKMGGSILAVALLIAVIVGALKILGGMEPKELLVAVLALAATLAILTFALIAMSGTTVGAEAMLLAAGAIVLLAGALKIIGELGLGTIIIAILGVAVAILVIAGLSVLLAEAVPFILAMGLALESVGLGALLFGVAAVLIAASILIIVLAIKMLVEMGTQGILDFIAILPQLVAAVVEAVLAFVTGFLTGLPEIIGAFVELVEALIAAAITLLPRFGELVSAIIDTILTFIQNDLPKLITAGVTLLMSILQGITDNIVMIVNTVSEIIVKFLNTLNENMPSILEAGLNLLITFLNGIAAKIGDVVTAAVNIVIGFIQGIDENLQRIIDAGGNVIIHLIQGIGDKASDIVTAAVDTVIAFAEALKNNVFRLIDAGWDLIIDFIDGLADSIDRNEPRLRDSGINLIRQIIEGMVGGIGDLGSLAIEAAKGLATSMLDGIKGIFNINSPSRETYAIAGSVAEGFVLGLNDDTSAVKASERFGDGMLSSLNETIAKVAEVMIDMDEFNPTITPVIDLTNVEKGAAKMSNLLATPVIDTSVTHSQAAAISVANREQEVVVATPEDDAPKVTEVKFEQNNYGTQALSTGELYRQTKSQIALAKEELVP